MDTIFGQRNIDFATALPSPPSASLIGMEPTTVLFLPMIAIENPLFQVSSGAPILVNAGAQLVTSHADSAPKLATKIRSPYDKVSMSCENPVSVAVAGL